MAALDSLGTVLSADLLIVGGGMAGLACAIGAKETDPEVDVLVVDKVVSGWGGKANKGGGNIVFVDPSEWTACSTSTSTTWVTSSRTRTSSWTSPARRAPTSSGSRAGACTSTATTPVSPSTCAGCRSIRGVLRCSTRTSRSTWPSTRASSACASGTASRSSTCSRTASASAAPSASACSTAVACSWRPAPWCSPTATSASSSCPAGRAPAARASPPRTAPAPGCAAPSSATSSTGCSPTPRKSAKAPRTCSTTTRARTSPSACARLSSRTCTPRRSWSGGAR